MLHHLRLGHQTRHGIRFQSKEFRTRWNNHSKASVFPVQWFMCMGHVQDAHASARRCVISHGQGQNSFDSDDELDQSLSTELSRLTDPGLAQRAASKMDMIWKIGASIKNTKNNTEQCTCCRGSGENECDWCHGTGVLTIGDQIHCSTATHSSSCPVCKGQGYAACTHCRGTGARASWLGSSVK